MIEKEKIEVMVWVDTSGSISQDELVMFMSEVVAILRQFRNVDLTIGDCDCQVNSVKEFRNASLDDVLKRFKLRGGGGTSHLPVFNWINKNKPNTKLVICFTDGFTSFPAKKDVRANVLWVVAGQWRAASDVFPFGEVIELPKPR